MDDRYRCYLALISYIRFAFNPKRERSTREVPGQSRKRGSAKNLNPTKHSPNPARIDRNIPMSIQHGARWTSVPVTVTRYPHVKVQIKGVRGFKTGKRLAVNVHKEAMLEAREMAAISIPGISSVDVTRAVIATANSASKTEKMETIERFPRELTHLRRLYFRTTQESATTADFED